MVETLLALLSPLWSYIAGGVALLFGAWLWKRKNAKIKRQQEVIQAHEAIEEVHKEDVKLDSEADKQITDIREKVDNATPEEGAGIVAEELNRYFGGEK